MKPRIIYAKKDVTGNHIFTNMAYMESLYVNLNQADSVKLASILIYIITCILRPITRALITAYYARSDWSTFMCDFKSTHMHMDGFIESYARSDVSINIIKTDRFHFQSVRVYSNSMHRKRQNVVRTTVTPLARLRLVAYF